jgi:hypothetical protein
MNNLKEKIMHKVEIKWHKNYAARLKQLTKEQTI